METFTHLDYEPGRSRHNSEVFRHIWRKDAIGVEDRGVFFTDDGGGGYMQTAELAEEIRDSDKARRLSMTDCINAAGQLLRGVPPMFYPDDEIEGEPQAVDPSWLEGEQDTGDF